MKREHKINGEIVTIVWEQGDLLEEDVDERMEVYNMVGTDENGTPFQADGIFIHGELEEIENIETI